MSAERVWEFVEAADRIREFARWKIFSPAVDDVLAALVLHQQAKLRFWEAMVVQAAAQTGCDVLWTGAGATAYSCAERGSAIHL